MPVTNFLENNSSNSPDSGETGGTAWWRTIRGTVPLWNVRESEWLSLMAFWASGSIESIQNLVSSDRHGLSDDDAAAADDDMMTMMTMTMTIMMTIGPSAL